MPRKGSPRLRHWDHSGVRWLGSRHWPYHSGASFGTDRGKRSLEDALRRRWSLSKGVPVRRYTGTLRHPCLVLTAGHTGGSSIFPWSCGQSYGSREDRHHITSVTRLRRHLLHSTIKTGDIPGTCSYDEPCLMTWDSSVWRSLPRTFELVGSSADGWRRRNTENGKHVRRSQGNFYLLCRHDVPNGGVEKNHSSCAFRRPTLSR